MTDQTPSPFVQDLLSDFEKEENAYLDYLKVAQKELDADTQLTWVKIVFLIVAFLVLTPLILAATLSNFMTTLLILICLCVACGAGFYFIHQHQAFTKHLNVKRDERHDKHTQELTKYITNLGNQIENVQRSSNTVLMSGLMHHKLVS